MQPYRKVDAHLLSCLSRSFRHNASQTSSVSELRYSLVAKRRRRMNSVIHSEPLLLQNSTWINMSQLAKTGAAQSRVSVHHFSTPLDLIRVVTVFEYQKCDIIRRDNMVFITLPDRDSGGAIGRSTILVFRKGGVVCWYLTSEQERCALQELEKCRTVPRGGQTHASSFTVNAGEHISVRDSTGANADHSDVSTSGIIHLTTSRQRASDQLGISLALISAVRLNLLENRIEANLERERRLVDDLHQNWKNPWSSSRLSEKLFNSLLLLHRMRNDLNNEQGLLEIPDVLWEFQRQERLYRLVQEQFDLEERVNLLNGRLTWTFDYLNCLSTFVEQKHSARLEMIIIALIFFELCVALRMEWTKAHEHTNCVKKQDDNV